MDGGDVIGSVILGDAVIAGVGDYRLRGTLQPEPATPRYEKGEQSGEENDAGRGQLEAVATPNTSPAPRGRLLALGPGASQRGQQGEAQGRQW